MAPLVPMVKLPLTVLAIESSCDETAAAVVRVDAHGARILSDVIASQITEHAPYGGVVPEVAARAHLRVIDPVVRQALAEANGWESLDAIAATAGPGLVGALLIGLQTAKTLAWARGLPFVGVNHLVGHILAAFLHPDLGVPGFPYVALLASGGHTALYRVDSPGTMRELGATRDDAAGEAFDKIARILGLGYPGGPIIDRLAAAGNAMAVPFTSPMHRKGSLEFSFSGLKTAVAQHVRMHGVPTKGAGLEDLAAGVQHAIVESLVSKLVAAAVREGVVHAVISGGVAANRGLRAAAAKACAARGIALHIPPAQSCTDNAAMIAYAGVMALMAGKTDGITLDARASWSVEDAVQGRR